MDKRPPQRRDHGASGAGKSWIACALGVAACNAFFSVRYVRLPEMLDELNVSKNEDWLKAKKRYTKCDLLILDDWLLEKLEGKAARELLEIVEARLRSGSLLIWLAVLGQQAGIQSSGKEQSQMPSSTA